MTATPADDTETSFRALMRQRAYLGCWLGRVCSSAGTQMLMVALGWQMYDLTGSAWDLGLVGLCQFLPMLLAALPAGHVADRFPRERIAQICMAALAATALVLVLAETLGHAGRALLLAVSVVLGLVSAFQKPALQALVPLLVPGAMLPRAMAFSSAGNQAAVIVGPALAGLVFVAGAATVHLCATALFAAGAVAMVAVRYARRPRVHAAATLGSVFAGVAYIWRRQLVLGAISLDLFAVLLGGAVALLPIYARDILHTGPWGLGLLRSAPAVGALTMSIALTRWPLARRVGRRLLGAVAIFGIATVVFGLSHHLWLSLAALVVTGAMDMVSVVVRQTLVQIETPDAMRGRVSSVNAIFIGASNQLGEFESGATAALLGPVGAVVLGGAGTIAVALAWLRLFPALARRDRMVEDEAARA